MFRISSQSGLLAALFFVSQITHAEVFEITLVNNVIDTAGLVEGASLSYPDGKTFDAANSFGTPVQQLWFCDLTGDSANNELQLFNLIIQTQEPSEDNFFNGIEFEFGAPGFANRIDTSIDTFNGDDVIFNTGFDGSGQDATETTARPITFNPPGSTSTVTGLLEIETTPSSSGYPNRAISFKRLVWDTDTTLTTLPATAPTIFGSTSLNTQTGESTFSFEGLVVTTLDDEDDGATSLNDPADISLREAITYSAAGETIRFDLPLNGEIIQLTSALGQLVINKDLIIDASFLSNGVIIDADGKETNNRALEIQSGTVTLKNLTFINGQPSGASFPDNEGGAILNNSTSPLTLDCCVLTDNIAGGSGGAIYSNGEVSNTSLIIQGCSISHNTSSQNGGGIYLNGAAGNASMDLYNSTVSENTAGNDGGGIHLLGSTSGSALLLAGDSTIALNTAGNNGGGIYCNGSDAGDVTFDLEACTIAENSAKTEGGGIYLDSSLSGASFALLSNTIVAANTAPIGPDLRDFGPGAGNFLVGKNLLSDDSGNNGLAPTGALIVDPNPKLSPLAYYGGKTQTIHPLVGSPAIDAGSTTDPGIEDQRGFNRFEDGNGDGFAAQDIGAVEAGPTGSPSGGPYLLVNTTNDEDDGFPFPSLGGGTSLREAIKYAAPRSVITFAPGVGLENFPITLSLGELIINKDLCFDATNISGGVTIDANGEVTDHRVMHIQDEASVSFQNFTLTGGEEPDFAGGAIRNSGNSLSLNDCTITGNSVPLGTGGGAIFSGNASLCLNFCTLTNNHTNGDGGAIYASSSNSRASTNLRSCTLSSNDSETAGAIYHASFSTGFSRLRLDSCTLSHNTSSEAGGGIYNDAKGGRATVSLTSCTVTSNSDLAGGGGGIFNNGSLSEAFMTLESCTVTNNSSSDPGGGIHNRSFSGTASLTLKNTILSSNASNTGPDLYQSGSTTTLTILGNNLLSSIADSGLSGSEVTLAADPLLSALGDYGGPTQTILPLPSSPARNGAVSSTACTDQRGFPRNDGSPDLGATEFQPELAGFIDNDNDQMDDRVEPLFGFDPSVSDAPAPPDPVALSLSESDIDPSMLEILFTTFPGRKHTIDHGPDLGLNASPTPISGTSQDFLRLKAFTPATSTPANYFARILQE